MLDQLGVADVDGNRARAKKLERFKAFIKFCRKRKWLTEDIAGDLKEPEGSSIPANKTPFTDEELKRIFAACNSIEGPTPPGRGHRRWGGEDVRDFVMLSVYTGLRISGPRRSFTLGSPTGLSTGSPPVPTNTVL